MTTPNQESSDSPTQFLRLKDFDYIELHVGNALQAAHFYRTAFGLCPVAYAGLETGARDRQSVVVGQQKIRLVLTSALDSDGQIAEHVKLHGDGVKDIALRVSDATQAFNETVKRGAKPVMEPTVLQDAGGRAVKASIGACGDTVHSFIERDAYAGAFLPGYQTIENSSLQVSTGLRTVDHVAFNVEYGRLDQWVEFYKQVLGFHEFQCEDVSTQNSAMNVKVIQDTTNRIKFSMVAPAGGRRRSQIEEFLMYYHGPGVQHFALSSDNIIKTVRTIRTNGVEFTRTPDTYYHLLESRIGKIKEDLAALEELKILADRDEWGYLLQIFTKPLQSRPTVFLEIIQRKGARGFGGGNIKALFEAVEREQELRGNL